MKIPKTTCKKWLTTTWFAGFMIMFLLLFVQSVFGNYKPHTKEAWEWFLPSVVPTFGLMLAAFGSSRPTEADSPETVDRHLFRLTLGLSGFYLAVLLLTILLLPFVSSVPAEKMAFLDTSNLWLAPFQGLVTASLGVFFITKA
jgi:hypothetical protein